jgi:ribosomal protein S18 acetylase RimI-like enzyme
MSAQVHPTEPHVYLFVLGARPTHQGQGLGSALLRHVLDRCDADGTPAYLEDTNTRNRDLYRRHGFAQTGEIRLPDGPPLYPMWRDPR